MKSIVLRKPCAMCNSDQGRLETRNGQDCVFCIECGKYQYNAPKVETGRKPRSVSTTRSLIKPKQRSLIIDRANGRCERCGKPASKAITGLHVGHIVSVDAGIEYGLSAHEINSDENLIAECDECNLGHGKVPIPLRVYVAILATRMRSA